MGEETKCWRDGSVFAFVLARLMDTHLRRRVDEAKALELAEWSGYDVEVFRARLQGDREANLEDLSQLAYELELSEEERRELAFAYTYREAGL